MSLNDLSFQTDCRSHLLHGYSSSLYTALFKVCSQPASSRSHADKKLLSDLLNNIPLIKETFKTTSDYHKHLMNCSADIEAVLAPSGSCLTIRGDKSNDVFIILKGNVLAFDAKPTKEVEKQKQLYLESITKVFRTRRKNNGLPFSLNSISIRPPSIHSLNSINVSLAQRRKKRQTKSQQSLTIIEDLAENDVKSPKFNNNQRESAVHKLRSALHFLSIPKPQEDISILGKDVGVQKEVTNNSIKDCTNSVKELTGSLRDDSFSQSARSEAFNPYSREESLLLENVICRQKYFKDGACLLKKADVFTSDDVINEKCLLKDFRCPFTMIADGEVQYLRLRKDRFNEILQEEIEGLEEKKAFFLNFFSSARETSIILALGYILQKKFKVHEKIFSEGDLSKGIYFIRGGGEVKLYLSLPESRRVGPDTITEAIHTGLFLPNTMRAHRKVQVAVAIVSKGDFFGEEDFILEKTQRKYTAVSTSNDLILYYIPPKNYFTVLAICPDILTILKDRSIQRSSYMQNKIKNCEDTKEKVKTPYQKSPRAFRAITQAQKTRSNEQNEHKLNSKGSFEMSSLAPQPAPSDRKVVLRDRDYKKAFTGEFPRHFIVSNRERELPASPKLKIDLTESAINTPKPNIKETKRPIIHKSKLKKMLNGDSVDPLTPQNKPNFLLPASYRLFEMERGHYRYLAPRLPKRRQEKGSHIDTGSPKHKDYLEAFQQLVLKQAAEIHNSSDRPLTALSGACGEFKKRPQFGITSYQLTHANSISPRSVNKSSINTVDLSSYHFPKSWRSPKPSLSRTVNLTSWSQMFTESTKLETGVSPRSTANGKTWKWNERNRTEAHLYLGNGQFKVENYDEPEKGTRIESEPTWRSREETRMHANRTNLSGTRVNTDTDEKFNAVVTTSYQGQMGSPKSLTIKMRSSLSRSGLTIQGLLKNENLKEMKGEAKSGKIIKGEKISVGERFIRLKTVV